MRQKTISVVLAIGIILTAMMLVAGNLRIHFPDNHQGYSPEQPIAFSHRLHAGELSIDCQLCHSAAERGRHAGIPAAETCLNCHRHVRATLGAVRAEDERAEAEKDEVHPVYSEKLMQIYDALALDPKNNMAPAKGKTPHSIEWVKVHNLPSFVYFDHSAHVRVGVKCQKCHGQVETMERVYQAESLSMGWCVNCHRDANRSGVNGRKVQASTDCDACHH